MASNSCPFAELRWIRESQFLPRLITVLKFVTLFSYYLDEHENNVAALGN
jgi:hypothetical protein